MFLGGRNAGDTPVDVYTAQLSGRCQRVVYPPPDSPEVAKYVSRVSTQHAPPIPRDQTHLVFIGQVPRLLPLQYIPWALDLLLEEYGTRWVLQTQPNGCAKAWAETADHAHALIARSKTLLFDVCGVWVARDVREREAVAAVQQANAAGRMALDGRVPRHGIVLEPAHPQQTPRSRAGGLVAAGASPLARQPRHLPVGSSVVERGAVHFPSGMTTERHPTTSGGANQQQQLLYDPARRQDPRPHRPHHHPQQHQCEQHPPMLQPSHVAPQQPPSQICPPAHAWQPWTPPATIPEDFVFGMTKP